MNERRRSVRKRSRLRGRLYFNDGRDLLLCRIHDISYEGARIDLFKPVEIPDVIKLYIPAKKRLMQGNVRWRHGNKVGVAFSDFVPHTA